MLSNGPAFTEAAEQYRAERDRAERNRPRDYIHPLPKPPERIDQFQTPSGAQSLPPRERLVDKFIPFSADVEPILDDAYLIEDVLPDEGLGVGYGPPGSGKTFQALDMAFAIAGAANDWRGRYVAHGTVLYFGMEGGRAFQNRVAAYAKEKGAAPHFFRCPLTLDLRSTTADAESIIAEARKHSPPVKMIVVDTLNRAMAGGNENAAEDMGAFIAICDYIRRAVGCFVLVVHHSGKDEAKGARGHTALLGAIDNELHFERFDDGCAMTITKQRDGEDGLSFGYKLRRVELGRSPRGKAITSCVVDEADVERQKKKPLGPNQRIALEALEQFVTDVGVPTPSGTGWPEPNTKRCVDVAAFQAFLREKMTSESPDNRRRTAKRAIDDLVAKGLVQTNGGMAWIIQ
ncbi:MAG: AAA family ATPase [Pseudomonadota bacterium]